MPKGLEGERNPLVGIAERAIHDRRVTTAMRVARIPAIIVGVAIGAWGVLQYVVETQAGLVKRTAEKGILLRNYVSGDTTYMNFPTVGVVRVRGRNAESFDAALAEVGRLCGAPTSISFSRAQYSDDLAVGYVTVGGDGSCLSPLLTELTRAANPNQ